MSSHTYSCDNCNSFTRSSAWTVTSSRAEDRIVDTQRESQDDREGKQRAVRKGYKRLCVDTGSRDTHPNLRTVWPQQGGDDLLQEW